MGKHLPAIDGLRAFAVLSVVAYHAGLPLSAGYVGVDVFFVISGYVITRMLVSEPRIDLLAFYARRVRRILPALLVVVAAVLALSTLLLGPDQQAKATQSAIASMGMLANVHFQHVTGGYWDGAANEMPLLHLWSLAVEEQFYLVWPLLLIAFHKRPWVLAMLAIGSLWLAQHWIGAKDQEAAFYLMPSRFWELAVGGLLVMLPKSRLGTAPVGLACMAFAVWSEPFDFPGIGAVVPVLGALLVLYAIHSDAKVRILEWKPVRYIGLISYSFYLWHWPLLAIAKAWSFDAPTLTTNLALCALAFVLASLSYHFVETPFRRTNPPKVRAIALGVTACALLAGCAAAVGATHPKDDLAERTRVDFPQAGCHTQGRDPATLVDCGEGEVMLWGDSHAYAWRPYADTLGKVFPMTRAGCMPVAGRHGTKCEQYGNAAAERAKQGKVVVIAARWSRYYGRDGGRMQADLGSALDALSGVPRVLVMGPVPWMRYDPQKCIARGHPERCALSRAEFEANVAPIRKTLQVEVAKHPNAEYVEPADYFCTATDCPLLKNGRSLYWDDDHIAASAAAGFARK